MPPRYDAGRAEGARISTPGSLKVEVHLKSSDTAGMSAHDVLSVAEVSRRSGFAPSALRFYESLGLIHARRTAGGQRRYERSVLRRLAFVQAAQRLGLTLEEIREALHALPERRTPTRADWARLSRAWRSRLDARIDELVRLRDGLSDCIGCGCLSLRSCRLFNPDDALGAAGPGPRRLIDPV